MSSKVEVLIDDVMYHLRKQIEVALCMMSTSRVHPRPSAKGGAADLAGVLSARSRRSGVSGYRPSGNIRRRPAANNKDEIILAYLDFFATTAYRIARTVPSERSSASAHDHGNTRTAKTGVDIHPAQPSENTSLSTTPLELLSALTSIIGSHVKVYQGVLSARSPHAQAISCTAPSAIRPSRITSHFTPARPSWAATPSSEKDPSSAETRSSRSPLRRTRVCTSRQKSWSLLTAVCPPAEQRKPRPQKTQKPCRRAMHGFM